MHIVALLHILLLFGACHQKLTLSNIRLSTSTVTTHYLIGFVGIIGSKITTITHQNVYPAVASMFI